MNRTQQKRFATTASFQFDDACLEYGVADNSGERQVVIDYAKLPLKSRRVFEKNIWLRNVGLVWCALGALALGAALISGEGLRGSGFWLILGFGCLAVFKATQTRYTVFDTEEGSIWIVEDAQHGEIVAELMKRRRDRLVNLYGALNLANGPEQEVQKVEWLVQQQALSREEADTKIREIRAQAALSVPSDRQLH